MSALDALQQTLAGEHAAVWAFALLGGRTSQSAAPALYAAINDAHDTHRERRDDLTGAVLELGGEPVAAAPTYQRPPRLDRPGGVARAAQGIERRCAETYTALVSESVRDQRAWAVRALADSAVRELAFGGHPQPFPGAPDLG